MRFIDVYIFAVCCFIDRMIEGYLVLEWGVGGNLWYWRAILSYMCIKPLSMLKVICFECFRTVVRHIVIVIFISFCHFFLDCVHQNDFSVAKYTFMSFKAKDLVTCRLTFCLYLLVSACLSIYTYIKVLPGAVVRRLWTALKVAGKV